MKRISLILIAALLALAFGCAASNTNVPAPTPLAPAQTADPAAGPIQMSTKPKTVTTEMDSVTLLIVNNSDKTYSTDYVQKLEMLTDGQWQEVPLTTEAVALGLIVAPAGEMIDYTFDFAYHYEPLTKGSYRIEKAFADEDGNRVSAFCAFDMF